MSCDKARKLLVERCQTEFEKGCWSDLDPSELEKVKFVTETTAKREDIQREFQKKVARTRRQWLQNIKFIGELYKEKILSARLIHRCLAKLLDESDGRFCDESLEGLCCLLSTIGEIHEWDTNRRLNSGKPQPKGIVRYDHYFTLVDQIIASKRGSLRIRFMLQDLRELRKNAWDSRWRQLYKEEILNTRIIHKCLANSVDESEKGQKPTKNDPERSGGKERAAAACPWTIDACPWNIDGKMVYCSSCQISMNRPREGSNPMPISRIRGNSKVRQRPVYPCFSPPWLNGHLGDESTRKCK